MNEMAGLERGYRRVLMCYPKAFRQESGRRSSGSCWPRRGKASGGRAGRSAALIRGGLRMRLRLTARPPRAVRGAVRLMCLGALVEAAAVVTIAVTAAACRRPRQGPGAHRGPGHQIASLLTVREVSGGVAVAVWLFLAWAIGHRRDVARFRSRPSSRSTP